MRTRWTIGKRIGLGFAMTLTCTLLLGLTAYWGMARVMSVMGLYREVNAIKIDVTKAEGNIADYMLNGYDEGRKEQEESRKKSLLALERSREAVRLTLESSVLKASNRQEPAQISDALEKFQKAFDTYVAAEATKMKLEAELQSGIVKLGESIAAADIWTEEMKAAADTTAAVVGGYVTRQTEQRWKAVEQQIKRLDAAVAAWCEKTSNSEQLRPAREALKAGTDQYTKGTVQYHEQVAAQKQAGSDMESQLQLLVDSADGLSTFAIDSINQAQKLTVRLILGMLGFLLLAGILYAVLTTRRIVGRIGRIVHGVHMGTEQIAAATGQLATSGQMLAEAASEQAAGVEETSSVMEELSSMTQRNADSTRQAKVLVADTNQVVSRANTAMGQLTVSMAEISKASEETSKIVKTIDEIAFQTNLLALNAAVEAARAGEAGAGFAVVADEVRNLAMRAAQAAHSTSTMIEGTVKKVKEGSQLVSVTGEAFKEVAGSSGKLGQIIEEIATASEEQSRGIEQVNQSMSEFDKITQQNAASAEESAAASDEVRSEAVGMQDLVAELAALVGTSNRNGDGTGRSLTSRKESETAPEPQRPSLSLQPPRSKPGRSLPGPNRQSPSPEEVLPLEDDDF